MSAIMQAALDSLTERAGQLQASIKELEEQLAAARLEERQTAVAVREQRKALERAERPAGGGGRQSTRAGRTREPAKDTQAGKVLDVARRHDGETISLGVLCTRTGMPSSTVRPVAGELVTRGYLVRVSDGIYRAVEAAAGGA